MSWRSFWTRPCVRILRNPDLHYCPSRGFPVQWTVQSRSQACLPETSIGCLVSPFCGCEVCLQHQVLKRRTIVLPSLEVCGKIPSWVRVADMEPSRWLKLQKGVAWCFCTYCPSLFWLVQIFVVFCVSHCFSLLSCSCLVCWAPFRVPGIRFGEPRALERWMFFGLRDFHLSFWTLGPLRIF